MKLTIRAALAFVTCALVGCGGSNASHSAMPQVAASKGTLTVQIPNNGVKSTIRKGESVGLQSSSIVVRYIGDGNPSSAPTNPFTYPANPIVAAGTPVNLETGAGGNCTSSGTMLTCTLSGIVLTQGVIDLYILDYDQPNGTGDLIYASVSTLQFNANGTLTAPGTNAPVVNPNALQPQAFAANFAEYPVPMAPDGVKEFNSIVQGPDGNIWFVAGAEEIGNVTPGGNVNVVTTSANQALALIAGAGQTLWYLNLDGTQLVQMSTSGTTQNTIALGSCDPPPEGRTCTEGRSLASSAGNVFVGVNTSTINNDYSAALDEINTSGALSQLAAINYETGNMVAGSNQVWVLDSDSIVDVSLSGSQTTYALPNTSAEYYVTIGPDGAVWFTMESTGSAIGRLAANGTVTVFPVSSTSVGLSGIATGNDGALWFTESGTNRLGRMTASGTVSEFPVPTANAGLGQIVAGPSNTLWFTEGNANQIGRYQL